MRINERTLGSLILALRHGDLLLPNFQRPFVWEPARWQAFMASLLLDYPTGVLLIGEEDSHKMVACKPYSMPEADAKRVYKQKAKLTDAQIKRLKLKSATEYLTKGKSFACEFLLDGQQRLTCIDLMIGRAFHDADGYEISPRNRWFLNLRKLGLLELSFPAIAGMSHEEAKELFIPKKYKKTDTGSPYHCLRSDDELIDFCLREENLFLPLDKIFVEESGRLDLNGDFLAAIFHDRAMVISKKTKEGVRICGQNTWSKSKKETELRKVERNLGIWRGRLEAVLRDLVDIKVSVYQLRAQDFDRLAGIFSVINLSPVALDAFDLLVAMTSEKHSNVRTAFQDVVRESQTDFKRAKTLLPSPAISQGMVVADFWSLGGFLAEKRSDEVDAGDEYPESISKQLSQAVCLFSKLNKRLGRNWFAVPKRFKVRGPALRKLKDLLTSKDWSFADKAILALTREEVRSVEKQAAKQLLRAYLFLKTQLGMQKLSSMPYRLMDLPLACALTDVVWAAVVKDPGGKESRRLKAWFWASITGGAYKEGQDARVLEDIPRLIAYVYCPDEPWSHLSALLAPEDASGRDRMSNFLNVPGYSDLAAMKSTRIDALAKAIRAIELAQAPPDFEDGTAGPAQKLHSGRDDVQGDHLFALAAWKKLTGEAVRRDDSDHLLNTALNATVISKKANRYWSELPLFQKSRVDKAKAGDTPSKDFIAEHFLSINGVSATHTQLSSAHLRREDALEIVETFLDNRHESLRQHIRNTINLAE